MKTRRTGGYAAFVLVLFISLIPVPMLAAGRDRESKPTPGDRIVRFVKQIRTFFVPISSNEGMTPPKP
jgi:hypothetical protein